MTSFLIVEDDEDKAEKLRRFVDEKCYGSEIEIARSLTTGLIASLRGGWDLVLLDMTMTNFDRTLSDDGGRPHHFAGREILRQMKREGVEVPVVIVTQFDRFGEEAEELTLNQLEDDLAKRFPAFRGIVRYRANVDDWQAKLERILFEVLEEEQPK